MITTGEKSPPASTKFVASCSSLVCPKGKKNKHSSDIKGNTKKDITELRKEGKRNEEERDLPGISNDANTGCRGKYSSSRE